MDHQEPTEYRIVFDASHEYQTNPGVPYYRRHYDIMPDRYHAQIKEVETSLFGRVSHHWRTIATTRDTVRYRDILEARIEDHGCGRLLRVNGSRVVATYIETAAA